MAVSLDGYVAGPDQSLDNPLGVGGMRLHEWAFATAAFQRQHGGTGGVEGLDSDVLAAADGNVGAFIMGRNMFTPSRGEWDLSWRGWWGDDPPYHAPVYVLTSHQREDLPMDGGTTFIFVTEGIEAALTAAKTAADGRDIAIAGGARTVQQFLAAGHLDRIQLHIVPITLGAGERLLDNVGEQRLQPAEVVASPAVTHVTYRVLH